jgi:hypothetical protein
MEVAQQVHGIGEVAARMAPRRFEQGIEVRMASGTLARDARELGFGNAERCLADGPLDRHSSPHVVHPDEALFRSS